MTGMSTSAISTEDSQSRVALALNISTYPTSAREGHGNAYYRREPSPLGPPGNECSDASGNPAAQRHGTLLARLVSLASDRGSPRNCQRSVAGPTSRTETTVLTFGR